MIWWAAFEATSEGDAGVQVRVLASPPGWGKTRIVQELHRRMAATQDEPAYWPAEIEATDGPGMAGVMQGRKRVYPRRVDAPAGAMMPWLWWGVLCHSRESGEYAHAWADDVTQVWAHGEAILAVPTDKAGRAFDATGALVGLAGLAGFSLFAPLGVALTVGGVARTVWDNRDLTDRLRSRRERRKDRTIDAAAHQRVDQAVETAENLAQIARKTPVVVVVDDAHDADESLTGLIAALVEDQPTARVLIVATAWPQALDAEHDQRPLPRWLKACGSDRVKRLDLDPLDAQELTALVLDDLAAVSGGHPEQAAAVAEMIVDRVGHSPLGARALLRLEEVQDAIADGDLTARDIKHLPGDLDAIFHQYWRSVPRSVRQVLERAALLGATYVPSVVVAAAISDGITDAAEAALAGVDPYAWVRPLNDDLTDLLHHFTDPLLYIRAATEAQKLRPAHLDHLHQQVVAAAIAAALNDEIPDPVRATLWQHHVTLAREGLASRDQAAADSAWHLAQHTADRYAYTDAITLATLALSWTEKSSDHPAVLEMRGNLAYWYAEVGRIGEAINAFEALLDDQIRVLGHDHPHTLTTRNNLASCYGQIGRIAEAITAFEALLADQLRVLGPDHADSLRTRSNLALRCGQIGRVEAAVTSFESLLGDRLRVLGHDHPDTLRTRNSLAYWYAEVGRIAEAITAFESLLTDQARVMGDDHPDTLTTRNNLVFCYGQVGRIAEAVAAFEALMADRLRVLGPDHPDTLATRHNLARCYGQTGRVEEAINAHKTLLDDRLRVLGPDHPDTLATRHNLALWYGEAGRAEEAITAFETLLADLERLLDADHPDALRARGNLARCYRRVGRVEEAATALEALLADQSRVLGPEHPDTLTTRNHLACRYGEAGRVEEAVTAFEALMADRLRVLGPDHPDTVTTRRELQRYRGQADQL